MEGFSKEELEMMSALRGETNAAKLGDLSICLSVYLENIQPMNKPVYLFYISRVDMEGASTHCGSCS